MNMVALIVVNGKTANLRKYLSGFLAKILLGGYIIENLDGLPKLWFRGLDWKVDGTIVRVTRTLVSPHPALCHQLVQPQDVK